MPASSNVQLRITTFVAPMPSHQRSARQSAMSRSGTPGVRRNVQSSIVRLDGEKRLRQPLSSHVQPLKSTQSVPYVRSHTRKHGPF